MPHGKIRSRGADFASAANLRRIGCWTPAHPCVSRVTRSHRGFHSCLGADGLAENAVSNAFGPVLDGDLSFANRQDEVTSITAATTIVHRDEGTLQCRAEQDATPVRTQV